MFDSIAVSVFVVILVDFEKYKSETSRLKEYPPEILGGAGSWAGGGVSEQEEVDIFVPCNAWKYSTLIYSI